MQLYRISPDQYLEDYSGLGASYRDGARWNVEGIPVIYFATSASLAMLELANYLPSPRLVPGHYRLGIYTLSGRTKVDTWSVVSASVKPQVFAAVLDCRAATEGVARDLSRDSYSVTPNK